MRRDIVPLEGPTISRTGWSGTGPTLRWSTKLRGIDFYFLNLRQLRHEIIQVFRQSLPEPEVVMTLTT